MSGAPRPYRGEPAVLATMQGKERVVAPLLERALGLRVNASIDTDRFGTFSREVPRTGSQLDAARAKIAAAFEGWPAVRVAIAGEGSFGPHPCIPVAPLAREIVVLADRATDLELVGHHASLGSNFGQAVVSDLAAATAFAERVGFPKHGLIVMGCVDGQPSADLGLDKSIHTRADRERAGQQAIGTCGAAFVETDMRAHRNPTRMRAIKRATLDLIRHFRSQRPARATQGRGHRTHIRI